MAHFAKLNENGIVMSVHVVNNNVIIDNDKESEILGINFLSSLHNHQSWKQTSYNGNFRKNYARIGYKYDEQRDAFIPPKPYESWVLNEETCLWDSPTPRPDGNYFWDEETKSWKEFVNDPI